MKKLILMGMIIHTGYLSKAQSSLTQKLEQIVKLQVYISQLEKGYSIVQKGLTTIGDIKNGHFTLDKNFLAGLQAINPQIKKDGKVSATLSLKEQIANLYEVTMKAARGSGSFSGSELDYMERVFTHLLDGCSVLMDELTTLLNPSQLQMTDDERIRRIGKIYDDMQDRSAFAQAFSNEAKVLTLQRSKEKHEAATIRKLYGY